ncbi:MAG: YfhO family protein [Gemmatimonadota bacterium]|nr:YfhO family protein [Gemmatimonadota bacterium]
MTRPLERERPAAPVPAPRFATAWAALVYAVATLTLGWPALVGKFLVNERSDQYIAGYAFREFAASWFRAGHGVPLWNPYLFGGLPYVAGMHGDIFYPTALLRLVLPTDVAMTWGLIIHVVLAGLFTFLFLRAVGLSFSGALIGGLAYMLAGNVAGLVSPGHDGKLFVSALLPLALLFLHRGVRDGHTWAWGALALTITLAVLTPHPQLLQYLLLTSGAYALFVAFGRAETGEALPRPAAIRRLGLAAVAVGIGLLGGAIQFLPLFEYAPWSPRAGGAGWEHAISYSLPPEELLNFYVPQFSGILDQYWGRNFLHHHSEYVGASVLVLSGLAFGGNPPGARRRFLWFWTGALVVATLWALGGYTPFYRLVYALVPGTKFFRAPSTMLYVISFSIAVLAAVGTERALTRREIRPRYLLAWLAAGIAVAVLATSGALTNVATTLAPAQLLERVDESAAALTLGAWRSFLVVGATAGVLFAMWRGKLSAPAAGWALAAVIAIDLWSVERLYWRFSPPASVLFRSDPVVDYLKRMPQPGRVLPYALQPLAGSTPDPYLRYGDGKATGLMVHGVRSVVGYHGNELGRYQLLTGWDIEREWVQRFANPNLRRLSNTRYWYTNAAEPPLPSMRLVAGPATNAAGNIVYLYEFAEDNPAAWVAPIAIKAPDENVLATVLDPRFDVRRAALFDTAARVPAAPVPPSMPPASDVGVRVTRYEPGHISLTLDRPAPAGSALIVSENYYPGWTATADGRPAPTGRVQYVLIGVALPTGARSVELMFRSATYERGRAITLASLATAALLLVGGVVMSRRQGG